MQFLGTIAAMFAVLLLLLPTVRVAQGRLTPRTAAGLWISGAGFLLLAVAALHLTGDAALVTALAGVAATVAGNIVQRRISQSPGSQPPGSQ
jgi:drug/metabolite transporter (DMT)-like permease